MLRIALAVRAGERGNGHVVGSVYADLCVGRPAEHDAGEGAVRVLRFGRDHRGILCEGLGIQQALRVQAVDPLHGFLVVFLNWHEDRFTAVVQRHKVGAGRAVVAADHRAEGGHQVAQVAAEALRGGIAVFVCFAVAVRVLCDKGLQHSFEILIGVGHFEAQRVEPCLVDVHDVVDLRAQRQLLGQAVDFAVSVGDDGLHRGVRLKHPVEVGHVFCDQVGELHEIALVLVHIGVAQAERTPERVGQIAGGQQQGFLLGPVAVVVDLPVDVDAGLLLDFLHDAALEVIGRPCVCPADGRDRKGRGIRLCAAARTGAAFAAGGCGGFAATAAGREGNGHREREQQAEQLGCFFHCIDSFLVAGDGLNILA